MDFFKDGGVILIFKDDNLKKMIEPIINDKSLPRIEPLINKEGKIIKEQPKINGYTDEDLIHFVKLKALELGREPKLNEMRGNGFPSTKTFSRRHPWEWFLDRIV